MLPLRTSLGISTNLSEMSSFIFYSVAVFFVVTCGIAMCASLTSAHMSKIPKYPYHKDYIIYNLLQHFVTFSILLYNIFCFV